MTTAFISDLHLAPTRPQATRLFLDFAAQAARQVRQLYILGDLFDYWIGDDAGARLGYVEVENTLRGLTEAGVEILFLPGNRDFLVGESFAARTGCRLLPDPTVICPAEQRIVLTHGDALCTDDVDHQTARREMLSAKWKTAFLREDIDERIERAKAMRRRSTAAKQNKPRAIMDVNQRAVEECMRKHNARLMIHGHTHLPATHEFELDGKPACRYVLGDWPTRKSVLYCDSDGRLRMDSADTAEG